MGESCDEKSHVMEDLAEPSVRLELRLTPDGVLGLDGRVWGLGDIVIPLAPQGAESSSQVGHDKLSWVQGGAMGVLNVSRLSIENEMKKLESFAAELGYFQTMSDRDCCPAVGVQHHDDNDLEKPIKTICGLAGMDRIHVLCSSQWTCQQGKCQQHARGELAIECGKRGP